MGQSFGQGFPGSAFENLSFRVWEMRRLHMLRDGVPVRLALGGFIEFCACFLQVNGIAVQVNGGDSHDFGRVHHAFVADGGP